MAVTAATVVQQVNTELKALAPAGKGLAAGPVDTFCSTWPEARVILAFLAGIAGQIPAAAKVAAVLTGLIKIGDATAAEVCK